MLGLDSAAQCSYMEGPHSCEGYEAGVTGRAWWTEEDKDPWPALKLVVEYAQEHGPFDGAYGFSQGCAVVSMLSDAGVLASLGRTEPLWRFAVLACGTDHLIAELQPVTRQVT